MANLVCMTLPYAGYSFTRALEGIAAAGFRYVSFGLAHEGTEVPDENDAKAAARLKSIFNEYGLKPLQLIANAQFAPGQPLDRALRRIELARDLDIPEVLTVGAGGYRSFPDELLPPEEMAERHREFVEQYQRIAAAAAEYAVTITIKPHTGNTATAADVMKTLKDIGASNVLGSYDPGNVQYYEGVNAARDFPQMAASTYSIVAKDHRGRRAEVDFPVPGTGDVDFPQIYKDWKAAGGDGTVMIERVDGPTDDPAQIDERLRQSYESVAAQMEQAGLKLSRLTTRNTLRILLTNDDGIHAPGLHAAWRALKEVGEVTVCVPDRPRSACAHQITMHKPLRLDQVETADGTAHTSNGTPADCVPLALLQLMEELPDLVVSGINLGPNLGDDVHYSGTVAGAMEGVLNGIPSFAISLADWSEARWEAPAAFCAEFAVKMRAAGLPRDTFVNVNVPNLDAAQIKGVRVTTQGSRRYKGDIKRYEAPYAGTYFWRGGEIVDRSETGDTDILAVKEGYISVTPLHVDLTRHDALETLRQSFAE